MHKNEKLCQEIIKRIDTIPDDELKKMIISLVETQEIINRNYLIDPLTQLYNRRIIEQILNYSIIIMCDIDNFKLINDYYGHLVGDRILQFVSRILKANVRHYDFVCRYGGDEFLLAFSNCDEKTALKRMGDIQDQLLESHIIPENTTLSIGVSLREEFDSVYTSIEKADRALYYSKLTGKNAITVHKRPKRYLKRLATQDE